MTDGAPRIWHFALLIEIFGTAIHSTPDTPLALDVAVSFLESKYCRRLPVWLEQLLLGVERNVNGGAFAPRTKADCKKYLGNPSALLKLYTYRGMFEEACNVVTVILGDNDRAVDCPLKRSDRDRRRILYQVLRRRVRKTVKKHGISDHATVKHCR